MRAAARANSRGPLAVLCAAAVLAVAAPSQAAPAETVAAPVGYSIFKDTIGDMTWPDVERAAKAGAVAIWGLAVIEEHGPALPLATDTYGVSATGHQVKADLAKRGIASLIVPPFYWGVNEATGAFPGSIDVRPAIMTELMIDVLKSLAKTGFTAVYCLPGHGDQAHNRAIYEAVKRASAETGVKIYMVTNLAKVNQLKLDPKDPAFVLTAAGAAPAGPPPQFVESHSGAGEHSSMWGLYPDVVKLDVIPTLKPSNTTEAQMDEWRKGYDIARRITPLGYVGAPANANPEQGRRASATGAARIADAIADSVRAAK